MTDPDDVGDRVVENSIKLEQDGVTGGEEPVTTSVEIETPLEKEQVTKTEVELEKPSLTNGNGHSHPQSPPVPINPLEPIPNVLRSVEGIDKLRRAIGKELVSENSNERCSNLPQLLSIVDCVLPPPVDETELTEDEEYPTGSWPRNRSRRPEDDIIPSAVLKPFNYCSRGKTIRFIVDIVSKNGDAWAKVSARNPKSLALLAAGGGGYGQKSILDHAKDYLECAVQNPAFFRPPGITFIFTSGIGASLARKLESLGIKVKGERIEDSELAVHPRIKPYQHLLYESDSNSEDEVGHTQNGHVERDEESVEPEPRRRKSSTSINPTQFRNPSLDGITQLNLDITALLAYVSNLTNGHINVHFKTDVLTQQLESERRNPQKPILDAIFRGRELFCCETALREFNCILKTVGGELEKQRAIEFLKRVKIVPDHMSERSKLDIVGNIKLRSLTIFGTGDTRKAVTVTANSGFVRSAKNQGVEFPVFLHESRALTEGKELFYYL